MEKIDKLVTVIVPIYNVQKYVSDTVESIINQTYHNLEIILVDDGSKDESGKICDEYAIRDSRIVVVHQANEGVSSARNKGLSCAKGEYITFIDGDDYILPDYIETLYNALIISNSDMSVSILTNVYPDGKKERDNISDLPLVLSGYEFLRYEILERFNGTAYLKMYKKNIIDRCNINFNNKITNLEDMLYLAEYANKIYKVNYISYSGYFRNVRYDGVAFSKYAHHKITGIDALNKIEEIIKSEDIIILKYNKFKCAMGLLVSMGNEYLKYKEDYDFLCEILKDNYNFSVKILSFKEKVKYHLYTISPKVCIFIKKLLKINSV